MPDNHEFAGMLSSVFHPSDGYELPAVIKIIKAIRKDEREACAKVADERAEWARKMYDSNYRAAMAEHIANVIRERG